MKKLLIMTLIVWQSVAFANDAEFQRGVEAWSAGDYKEAFAILKPLAENGNSSAQVSIGWQYEKGQGVSQDNKEAIKWYRMAGKQGNTIAQFNLGVMYEKGQGTLQNYAEAVKWYRKAGKQGHVNAQYNLGVAYAKGNGISKNYIHAYMWFNIANSNGNRRAKKGMELASKELTFANLQEAKRLSVQCLNSGYKNCE